MTRWPASAQPYVRTPECPPWCSAHVSQEFCDDSRTTHYTLVTVGTACLTVEQIADGSPTANSADPVGPAIYPALPLWINGQDAHDCAEAMRQAAQLVHPLGGEQR